jgi:ABC-type sugar transport system ATPase subunit
MAQVLGIGIVFQERSLVGSLDVAENIFAGRQPASRWGVIDHRALYAQARAILDQLGLDINPREMLGRLSPAQQQMIEIAKAVSLNAQLLIFDEPTSALTDTETHALFDLIRRLKAQQAGIVYISHRLEEVFEIADRVTVLKDGEYRGTFNVSETTPDALISRMVGRDLLRDIIHHEAMTAAKPVVLEVRRLTDCTRVKEVSFSVRAGEILALAGLAGAGRTELALAIFGAAPRRSGEIYIDGKRVEINSPQDAMAAGLGYLPEERREAGLFLEMSVAQNICAARFDYFGSWWINDHRMDVVANDYREKLKIVCPDVRRMVQNLSGGNQQKVVLSRWLLMDPKVLIVDEPTRGIDVGAKAEVHSLLHALATQQGTAIVLISSELPEILAVADRILVMHEGRISGELTAQEATEEAILRLASTSVNGGSGSCR